MLNVVIVGAGLMGHHHAMTARRLGAAVVGVVDLDRTRGKHLARQFAGARCEPTVEAMRAAQEFDVAHVCSPASTHVPIMLSLAAAQVHVLAEKPLSETAEEAGQISAAFERTGALFCPVHQYAFQKSMDEAVAQSVATIRMSQISFEIASAGGGDDPAQFDRIVGEILPHPLSMLQRLLPDATLADLPWHVARAAAGEWIVTATHSGVALMISLSLASRPTRFLTRVSGAGGTIELDNFHDYSVRLSDAVSKAAKITGPFVRAGRHLLTATSNLAGRAMRRESAYPGLRQLTEQFYRAVERRDAALVPVSVPQTIDCARARDIILKLAAPSR